MIVPVAHAQLLKRVTAKTEDCLKYRNMLKHRDVVICFYSDLIILSPPLPPSSYINQRNRSWNIVESEKALVVSLHSLQIPIGDYKYNEDSNEDGSNTGYKFVVCERINLMFFFSPTQAEGQNAKNQQMDPFTRRQCKPTMVSNVRNVSYI